MVELSSIIKFMEESFPTSYAADYDNVGLLLGREERQVKKVLLCLDCDLYVVREAVKEGVQLIISHHPVIFGGVKSVSDSSADGKMMIEAIENGISVYCAHTNLDSCPGGLTDYLCKRLELQPLEPIEGNDGRICVPKAGLRLLELCAKIKKELEPSGLATTARMNRPVKKVALCNGSGASMAKAAREKGADVFVSGDVKYHQQRDFYLDEGFEYIEISHYDSEKIVTELLFDRLKERFGPELEAVISKENPDPMTKLM